MLQNVDTYVKVPTFCNNQPSASIPEPVKVVVRANRDGLGNLDSKFNNSK